MLKLQTNQPLKSFATSIGMVQADKDGFVYVVAGSQTMSEIVGQCEGLVIGEPA